MASWNVRVITLNSCCSCRDSQFDAGGLGQDLFDNASAIAFDVGSWSQFSLSYYHNLLWAGEPAYRFSQRINDSTFFESQAYTGLVRVGPREFLVLYNKYWDELYDGMPGCNPSGDSLGCSTAFAMRVGIVGS